MSSEPHLCLVRNAPSLTYLKGEWEAKGLESATKFDSIALEGGEWFDYDEKAGAEVSIKDVQWEIRRA